MSWSVLDTLPEDVHDRVRATLASAFAGQAIETIAPLNGGASGAFPFRVEAGRRTYLMRIEGKPSPLRNPQQYDSLRIAAQAGIAPRIHFLDSQARVAITDFIAHRPLQSYPGGALALVVALGALLRRLQETPIFPAFVAYPDIVARLFAHVRRTGLFTTGVLDPHVERLERLSRDYAAGATALVSSHNDCIPANILFDGERLWLIDWESAYRNDALVDVATTLDTLAGTPELEAALLSSWLRRNPDPALIARLDCVRALTRLYYAGVFLSASAAAGLRGETDLTTPSLAQFRQAVAAGKFKPATPQTKHMLGKMFLASFVDLNVPPPGFDAAV